ncbi:MAG TPA: AmmeMemoRadiSam system protein B [Bacteroidetes bacterium]|nr:AmmeMemoRadiSam system protein B [Bacteroidota bacterium]
MRIKNMLVFSAITPHPPILIPSIGQESLEQIKKTQQAMQELAENFYVVAPETVIVISPHGRLMENSFTLNGAPDFSGDFGQFGDLETQLEFKGDVVLAYKIREYLETKFSIQMIADSELDHGVSVPLYYLTQKLKKVKIVPVGYCLQESQRHFELGQAIAEVIHDVKKRVAVIASGDLSHCLTKNAPVPYNEQGREFDKKLIDLIKNKKIKEVVNLDRNLINQAAECGWRSILILLGILSEHNFIPEVLSYEGPFGVGYLVCNFELNR